MYVCLVPTSIQVAVINEPKYKKNKHEIFIFVMFFFWRKRFLSLKVIKDGFSAEKKTANCAESKKVQAGDVSYEENSAAASLHARLEIDGISAEKSQLQAMVS